MPPRSSVDDLLLAKFEALLAECDLVAENAAYGETLNDMEEFFLVKGRKLLQETFEQKLQERVKRVETTAEAKECSCCKKKRITKTRRRKASPPSTAPSPLNVAIGTVSTAILTPFPLK